MLTRLRFRRDYRIIARFMSDKPTEGDGKLPDVSAKSQHVKKQSDESKDKIQQLLKLMMSEPKIKESEYKDMFTTAPVRKSKKSADAVVKVENIEENLTKAASEVASAIGGNVKQTEAELLTRVLGKINQTTTTLSDLIIGMKVDRSADPESDPQKESRGQQVKRLVNKSKEWSQSRYAQRQGQPSQRPQQRERSAPQQAQTVDIFGGKSLGIFQSMEPNYGTKLDVWESLKERELTLATTQPPANYFQKMVLWTEQGKVWKFPIDNEQGLEEEQNIHFSEHIFLDSHLEGWCPKKGPIRHFMELVCVGLSKNAFYTAQEKKEHIQWYREYFEAKKDLLSEVGAWDTKNVDKEASA